MSNDRTDYNTLIPVIKKHFIAFEEKLKEVTADSGYCSEKNLLFLKEHNIDSYIELQDHEKRKTRAYREDIGKHYNMTSHTAHLFLSLPQSSLFHQNQIPKTEHNKIPQFPSGLSVLFSY